MNKKECDIIKDLLPSYVDNICSEASKEWIEAHLSECKECCEAAEIIKTTEFSAKQLDYAQVNATTRVKKKQFGNNMIIFGLCMLMMLATAGIFADGSSAVSHLVLYAELPVCMVITWFANRGRQAKRSWDKWDTLSLVAAVFAMGYGITVMYYMTRETLGGNLIFDLKLHEIGPFLMLQLMGTAVVCLVIYIIQMVRMYRRGSTNSVILSLSLMGVFLMLSYCVYLHQLTDLAGAVANLNKATFTVLDVGIMGTAVLAVTDSWSNKEK